jgi:hypothetical protein
MKKRILEVTPLISLLLFLFATFYLENSSIAWTFFLLIPLSWILLTGNLKKKIQESMPLITLIIFLWLGFGFDLWHPGWLIFLLVPIVNTIIEKRLTARKLVTYGVTAAYILLSIFVVKAWHPTWIIFLLIPIINTLFFPQKNAYVTFNKQGMKNTFSRVIIEEEKDQD